MSTDALKSSCSKPSYWRRRVEDWSGSGLSQAEYCRRSGIPLSTFQYWKRRLGSQIGADERSIVEVPIPATSQPVLSDPKPFMLHVASGCRIEVGGDFDPVILKKLIVTLEELS